MTAPSLGARIGARVLFERGRRKITRHELAARAGLSPAYLQKLEGLAVGNPTPETVQKLADALGLTVADLTADGWDALSREVDEQTAKLAELVRTARSELTAEQADDLMKTLLRRLEEESKDP